MSPEIHFAQIREDSRLERSLVADRRPARILCIGSGGCTALSLLVDGVEEITAVDANPAQCALLELKKAALLALGREAYLRFAGEAEGEDRAEVYRRLAPSLPVYARDFWDDRPDLLALGMNHCGTTEAFYRYVSGCLLRHSVGDATWREMMACGSVEVQRELFDRHFRSKAWKAAAGILLSRSTHLLFFPAFMFARAAEDDFGAFFLTQFEEEARTRPLAGNYFLSQFLFARYAWEHPEGCPAYLNPAGFEEARRNAHKLRIVPGLLQDVLEAEQGIEAFFLSNVFDWADERGREQLCTGLLRAKADRAVLLFRNMLSEPPLPDSFLARFEADAAESRHLREMERSMLYRRVITGDLT